MSGLALALFMIALYRWFFEINSGQILLALFMIAAFATAAILIVRNK